MITTIRHLNQNIFIYAIGVCAFIWRLFGKKYTSAFFFSARQYKMRKACRGTYASWYDNVYKPPPEVDFYFKGELYSHAGAFKFGWPNWDDAVFLGIGTDADIKRVVQESPNTIKKESIHESNMAFGFDLALQEGNKLGWDFHSNLVWLIAENILRIDSAKSNNKLIVFTDGSACKFRGHNIEIISDINEMC